MMDFYPLYDAFILSVPQFLSLWFVYIAPIL